LENKYWQSHVSNWHGQSPQSWVISNGGGDSLPGKRFHPHGAVNNTKRKGPMLESVLSLQRQKAAIISLAQTN